MSFINRAARGGHEAGEPGEGLIEHGGVEGVMDELSALFRNDQVGLAEQIEVIGNAGEAHDKMPADFAHGQVAFPQQFEDAAARRVVESAEELGHNI